MIGIREEYTWNDVYRNTTDTGWPTKNGTAYFPQYVDAVGASTLPQKCALANKLLNQNC